MWARLLHFTKPEPNRRQKQLLAEFTGKNVTQVLEHLASMTSVMRLDEMSHGQIKHM